MKLKGFTQSKNDYSLFLKKEGAHETIVAVYVDDIIVTGNDLDAITKLKQHMHKVFSIKDLGKIHYFLGIEVTYSAQGIILTQHKFTKELLQDCDFDVTKPVSTPLPLNLKLVADEGALYSAPD